MPDATPLRGAPLAEAARAGITMEIERLKQGGITPLMAVVAASDDPGVISYAEAKQRTAEKLGVAVDLVRFDPVLGQDALEAQIAALCSEDRVHGLLLALPLDPRLDAERAIARITPLKDVDGLTPGNLGLVAIGREDAAICPATPQACIRLAESVTELAGRHAAVIGRGRTVGRGLIPMLINRNATVTVCHTRTRNLPEVIAPCDLVFVAAGRPGLITGVHIEPGQIVIDAGINIVDGRVVGDVDAPSIQHRAAAFTPVPGGVGPLTSTLIFHNLLRAIELQQRAAAARI